MLISFFGWGEGIFFKIPKVVAHASNSCIGEAEKGKSLGLASHHSSAINDPQILVRILSQKTRWDRS